MKIRKIANYATGTISDSLPVGSVISFSSDIIPSNYLLCDGSAIDRVQYKQLFDVIGITYGAGDGNTTFNLPDYRGKVPVGIDSSDINLDALGKTYGEKTHTLTVNEMPSHNHDMKVPKTSMATRGIDIGNEFVVDANSTNGKTLPKYTVSTGGGQSHNNMQPSIAINYIIKAFDDINISGKVLNQKSNSQKDTYSCNYIDEKIEGNILFESNGTQTPIELNDDINNYNYIKIFYRTHNNFYYSQEIPAGKEFCLMAVEPWSSIQINVAWYKINTINNKTTLKLESPGYATFNNNAQEYNKTTKNIYITKIIGYK